MKASAARRLDIVRKKAEKAMQDRTARVHELPRRDVEYLVHELGVHQVELETQNEDLRAAQEELEQSRRQYAELYEFAPAGYFTLHRKGVILGVNRTGADQMGYPKERLANKPFVTFIDTAQDKKLFLDMLVNASTHHVGAAGVLRLRRRDRTSFDARVQMVSSRVGSATGECCLLLVSDITEQERMELALQQSEERYKLLFDRSPLPKWVFDLSTGRFLEVNDAAIACYGYSRDEFLGLTVADIRTPDEFSKLEELLRTCCVHGEKFEGQVRTRHRMKSGEVMDVDVRYTQIEYQGRRAGLAVITDITERIRWEQELERLITELQRSNRELQQFAYVASHDLQEPLRTVSSYVELLAMKYKGRLDPSADRYIAYAVEGAGRMSALINDLLAFSRVGTRGNQFSDIDMNAVCRQALDSLMRVIRENHAVITAGNLPVVRGDDSQLRQLLQNLISNAIKFRKPDIAPRIEVAVEKKGDEYVFSVKDNGIGIEPRFFDRIFQIFQRLHTREEYPGTGVGLAICRRIVERHGGRIWAESQPGEGSTFFFTLKA